MTEADALLLTAESGSIITMREPRFSVVIPRGIDIRVPAVLGLPEDRGLRKRINLWIRLKRNDGTIRLLYAHWILGKRPKNETRRWSVIRDVLGWVE